MMMQWSVPALIRVAANRVSLSFAFAGGEWAWKMNLPRYALFYASGHSPVLVVNSGVGVLGSLSKTGP
jgi:hypothetical protein